MTRSSVLTRVIPGVVDIVVLAPFRATPQTSASSSSKSADAWRVLTLQRGPDTRCTGAWEIVHGRIESGERPEDAAVREVLEETGLVTTRLYTITVNAFYLHRTSTVQMAIVFAAIVDSSISVKLGVEHSASRWHSFGAASKKLAWPREREALAHVKQLLRTGDAGPVEDVLRVF